MIRPIRTATPRRWMDNENTQVFFGIGDEVPKKLADARKNAREQRMNVNRTVRCGVCVGETSSGVLLVQRARSRMS